MKIFTVSSGMVEEGLRLLLRPEGRFVARIGNFKTPKGGFEVLVDKNNPPKLVATGSNGSVFNVSRADLVVHRVVSKRGEKVSFYIQEEKECEETNPGAVLVAFSTVRGNEDDKEASFHCLEGDPELLFYGKSFGYWDLMNGSWIYGLVIMYPGDTVLLQPSGCTRPDHKLYINNEGILDIEYA